MTKERFIHYMNLLNQMMDEESKLLDILDCGPEVVFSRWIDHFYEILKDWVGDTYDNIGYYVYELDWGDKWKEGMITDKDDNDIPLSSLDDLWNLIQKDKEANRIEEDKYFPF